MKDKISANVNITFSNKPFTINQHIFNTDLIVSTILKLSLNVSANESLVFSHINTLVFNFKTIIFL